MWGLQDYPLAMIELPASYQDYLDAQSERTIQAVRPVLMQSAADQLHGVRITYNPGATGHQAHLDENLPYGTLVEDID
jgi:hypothetical protein